LKLTPRGTAKVGPQHGLHHVLRILTLPNAVVQRPLDKPAQPLSVTVIQFGCSRRVAMADSVQELVLLISASEFGHSQCTISVKRREK
jgi:hypothetical protein